MISENKLVGLQRKAFLLLLQKTKIENSKKICVNITFLTEKLKISQLNSHNVLSELIKKNAIERVSFKRGRGGFTEFEINSDWSTAMAPYLGELSLASTNSNIETNKENYNKIKLKEKISNIYFIGSQEMTKVKIGESLDVDKRLKQHQTGNPDKLVIYRIIQNIPVSFEKELHDRFDHLRLEGEWFQMTEELKNYMTYVEVPQFVKNLILEAQNG